MMVLAFLLLTIPLVGIIIGFVLLLLAVEHDCDTLGMTSIVIMFFSMIVALGAWSAFLICFLYDLGFFEQLGRWLLSEMG